MIGYFLINSNMSIAIKTRSIMDSDVVFLINIWLKPLELHMYWRATLAIQCFVFPDIYASTQCIMRLGIYYIRLLTYSAYDGAKRCDKY